jgi:hypothetical protein
MSKEQMRKDLQKHFRSKLRKLVLDTFEVHDAADLSPVDAATTLITELTHSAVMLLVDVSSMTPKHFGEIMERTFANARAEFKSNGGQLDDAEMEVMEVELLHPRVGPDVMGILPDFLDLADPRPVREQFNERYAHGGGWSPMSKWKLLKDNSISYPGEDPLKPLAQLKFRKELVVLYEHSWVAIIQPDRTFEISRMD